MKVLKHALIVIIGIMILVIWPLAALTDVLKPGSDVDAVSSASLALPDQPSGAFYVLINTSKHADTLDDWRAFFTDAEDFAVIFEDISCLTAYGDVAGEQLAQRYQAQLPENQMLLRGEAPALLASKAETGFIDVAVFSREMAEALALSPGDDVTVIEISGGTDDAQV